jgi:odd-skipped
MEESPHKCPVCNRSFNQRSNLKTHLLTHTDHKPYECSCGKVFRRNCDLRRHALTHAVGDVPGMEQGDSSHDDIHNISDGEEEDTLLEVDSPLHSPNNSGRSPSPLQMPVSAELQDEHDEIEEEVEREQEEEMMLPPPTPAPEKVEKDIVPVTHCHHERSSGSQSPYTMRPQTNDRERRHRSPTPGSLNGNLASSQHLSHSQDSLNSSHIHAGSSSRTDIFMPMLHVRRDLHHKLNRASSTVTSGLVDHHPNFLSNIPLRKRPIGPDGEPFLPSLSRGIGIYGHPLLKPTEELLMPPPIINATDLSAELHSPPALPQLMGSPPPPTSTPLITSPQMPTNLSVPSSHHIATSTSSIGNIPQPQQQQPTPSSQSPSAASVSSGTPKRSMGFSIEDIMRR